MLRHWPEGNLWSDSFMARILRLLPFETLANALFFTYAVHIALMLLFFGANFFYSQDTTFSLLSCLVLFYFPWFLGFIYFDTQLVEIFFLFVILFFLGFYAVSKKVYERIIALAVISANITAFFLLRPVTYGLSRLDALSSYGVGELHLILGVPSRIFFFIFPIAVYKASFFLYYFSKNDPENKALLKVGYAFVFIIFFLATMLATSNQNLLESYQETFLDFQEQGVIIDWWDAGYAWQYYTQNPTLWDGGLFNINIKKTISNIYLQPPDKSYQILQELRSNHTENFYLVVHQDMQQLTYLMNRYTNTTYNSKSTLALLITQQNIPWLKKVHRNKKYPHITIYKISTKKNTLNTT